MTDFEGLATHLLSRIRDIIPTLLPGGKIVGHEYECASINGGQGKSFKININTGRWADFASTESGGDIISLYAAVHGVKQSEAAEQLAKQYNYIIAVQENDPPMTHPAHGKPVATWAYRDINGSIIHYVARYDTKNGKEFMPWTRDGSRWVAKGPAEPRPLYGLEQLKRQAVLIVEGEKCVDAARQLLGKHYDVVTWSGGSRAIKKTDWSPLFGRSVLIWPDADEPGVLAATGICQILQKHVPILKVIDVSDRPKSWDAADALSDGMTTSEVIAWAKPRAQVIQITVNNIAVQVDNNLTVQADEPPAVANESMVALWDRLGLALSSTGNPIMNEDNVARIFERTPELRRQLWHDEFYNSIFIQDPNAGPREWTDKDTFELTMNLQREYGMSRLSDAIVRRAITVLAGRVIKNEPKDWMGSLKWDGVPRIDNFFISHLGAVPSNYVRAASKNFWVSMVARIYDPGCIMRSMVILKSKQLTGKSTAFSIIGGKWYSEALENIQSNNFLQSLHGNLLIEFGDLAGMDRAEVNRIKQIISCRKDRFRAPYERHPANHLRRCVLVGSTNEDNFLRDDTGGTRFWPIETGTIDHASIIRDRDQLFAEAVERFNGGENWHIMPSEETEEVQESYRQADEWENEISEWIRNNPYKVEFSVRQVGCECLRISLDRLDKSTQIRIARNLNKIGCERFQKFDDGKNVKLWRRGDRFL